jgi:hypothetical protein
MPVTTSVYLLQDSRHFVGVIYCDVSHVSRMDFNLIVVLLNGIVQLFVIEGDYIYLREGAHAKVSATTAVAKASAAAAAANPVGLDRLPTVAVTPVAQASQLQRGRNAKASNKDSRPQPQQDEVNIHTQRSISPQLSKAGNTRQNSASFVPRDGMSGPANGEKMDGVNNTTGAELGSKKWRCQWL